MAQRATGLDAARQRLKVVAAAASVAFVFGLIEGAGGEESAGEGSTVAEAPPVPELPGGGTTIFPDRRVVGFYGAPQDDALGILGIGSPSTAGKKLLEQAEPYESEAKPVLPAMELIAVTAAFEAGERGDYNLRQPKKVIDDYLAAARETGAILILDIQPGYADFLDEVRRLEEYLVEPDVSLALDPEWKIEPPGIPGQEIGSVDAAEVNDVSAYLQGLIDENNLPQKLLVIHQFTELMITNRDRLRAEPDVPTVLNSDGFGDPPNKIAKYDELRPQGDTKKFTPGFKLFYVEDVPVMSPKDVKALKPEPEFVVYE